MATYFTLLTPAGLAKVANAQLTNEKLLITEVAVGDANGTPYQPTGNETVLKREVWRGGIASIEIDTQNANWIVVEAVIPASAGGFSIREVGLFDADGTMVAIGNYPDTYKPVITDGSTMDLALRTIIEVNNTSSVTLRVDPNVIVASRAYVDSRLTTVNNNITVLDNRLTAHINRRTVYDINVGVGAQLEINLNDYFEDNKSILVMINGGDGASKSAIVFMYARIAGLPSSMGQFTEIQTDVVNGTFVYNGFSSVILASNSNAAPYARATLTILGI